jgi:hypothetical protein
MFTISLMDAVLANDAGLVKIALRAHRDSLSDERVEAARFVAHNRGYNDILIVLLSGACLPRQANAGTT